MGQLRIFCRITSDGKIECYEDSVCVLSFMPHKTIPFYESVDSVWRIYTQKDNSRYRVERDFGILGRHSVVLTTTDHSIVPFTIHLLDKVIGSVALMILLIILPFGYEGLVTVLYTLIVAIILIFIIFSLTVSPIRVRKQKEAIISFFTFPPEYVCF